MTSRGTQLPDGGFLDGFGLLSQLAVLVGGIGSVYLMLITGRRNDSALLMTLFTLWVLGPFIALGLASLRSKSWLALTRTTLYGVMLIVSVVSLIIYAVVALGPPRPKGATAFVLTPVSSWLLMIVAVSVSAFVARRNERR